MTTETICQESNIAEFIRHSHKDVIFFHIHIYDLWFYQAGRNRANLPQLELLDPGKYLATLGVKPAIEGTDQEKFNCATLNKSD